MKPLIIFLLLFIYLRENSFSQNSSCIDSSTRFLLQAGSARINIKDSEVFSDSSVVFAGNIRGNTAAENYLFIGRLDKYNNILFTRKLNGFTGFAKRIIECNNGDILVAALTYVNNIQTPFLFRFSINGNMVWQKQVENTGIPFSQTSGNMALYESNNGNIFLGTTGGTDDQVSGIIAGYYYIHKLTSSGNSLWKATLVQNDNMMNYINGIKEENGNVLFITQQYFIPGTAAASCTSTDAKSVSLFRLNNNGSFIDAKTYCLNFSGIGCLSTQTNTLHSAGFMPNGRIIISGQANACSEHRFFTMEMNPDFSVVNSYSFNYVVPYSINYGLPFVNRFGQVSLFSRGHDGSNFLYATFNTNGTIIRQRKLQLPVGGTNSPGSTRFAFRKPDQFLIFSNYLEATDEKMQVMEFKGNNNGTADCTGKDTTFMTSEPHAVVPIAFNLDTTRIEIFFPVNTSFPVEDFTFSRSEVCSSVSICDSLKIIGNDSVCLNNPLQDFIAIRNPNCNKLPEWRIADTSAILSMQPLSDTVVRIQFRRPWQGYLYAYSSSCTNLLDSFYINVFPSPLSLNLGRDTVFCSPTTLDAGTNYSNYQWQDNSIGRFYTVTGPGIYHITAKDFCGNISKDSIVFNPKKTNVSIGTDTCISSFPYVVKAGLGFKSYLWQDGSTSEQLSVAGPGLYYVTAVNSCNDTYNDSVRIYRGVQPFSLGIDTFLCAGSTISLQPPVGYQRYYWQDGSSGSTLQADRKGIYFVTVTDFCGKIFTDTINITEPGNKINLGPDLSICKNESIRLTANGNYITYNWSPSYNISSITSKSVLVNPEHPTLYYVTAATAEGCISGDSIMINIKDCPQTFFVPSGFTPNNDGRNDLFKPTIMAPFEKYEFSIYNRWGQRIFYTTEKSKGWNGKFTGLDQDSGSFVWTCVIKFYNQPAIFKKGVVLLIR